MSFKFQVSTFRLTGALGAVLVSCFAAVAEDFASLRADRAAIERVFYNHRLGEKPPFEQVLPPPTLENLVRQDMRKEAALKKVYGVEVAPTLVAAEVERINATTRAPDVLAEIKAALDNDPARFARAMARPILVERLLREKFDNDDALHAPQRHTVEMVRRQLLTARSSRGHEVSLGVANDLAANRLALLRQSHSNKVIETTWQLGPRPAGANAPGADEIEIKKRFGQKAQVLSSPPRDDEERKFYFGELSPELQNVLRAQLRQPGDVSAVIEMPSGFLLYLAREKTAQTLSVATLSIPKRSYEQWLDEQKESKP